MDNGKITKITKQILVTGIVQGVGFRPYIYRVAKKYNIDGTVRNIGGKVEIIVQSTNQDFHAFLQEINYNKENNYKITNISFEDIEYMEFSDFKIIESGNNHEIAIIPPDLPVCKECEKELYKMGDRRYENPFISCMACGPRYTIIEKLPYDRIHTTMKEFPMCPSCENEYTSPNSRRFHAQTISCNDCGPYLLFDKFTNKDAFLTAVSILKSGGIIAVKGIGGYHFACSPFLEETVVNLRKLKGREEKPFAVMFENLDSVREYCILSEEEKTLIESKARPIVLLNTTKREMAKSTNKESQYCGAFLPYTALQKMLVDRCGPLIMTSANISNQPIIKDDEEMLSISSPYLKGVLYHTRKIIRSVDDSVAKIIDHKPQLIRRSRGFVPYPVFLPEDNKDLQIFAAGSDLKAAFCLYKKGYAVVSQYFGDLEELSIFDEYKNAVDDLTGLLSIVPNLAVCDLHPNYYSARYAKNLGLPILFVQHHHAHIASVMAEHDLKGKITGVAFDGTGYGADGNIWGGEFLLCEGGDYKRVAHLKYTPLLGGDGSMRDGKKSATCFLLDAKLNKYIKDNRSHMFESAIKNNINTVLSSSMGRLFDAVASILGIQDENGYEGECAIKLEKEAALAQNTHRVPPELSFIINHEDGIIKIDPRPLLERICSLVDQTDAGLLALGFHYAVANGILRVCEIIRVEHNSNTVALSGGVFQNSLLTKRVLKILRENDFNVYMNQDVPPNDGCISLGQTYVAKENSLLQYYDKE